MSPNAPTQKLGLMAWYSLNTPDSAKSLSFWKSLFDLKTESFSIPGEETVTLFAKGDQSFAHVNQSTPSDKGARGWNSFITVENVDRACERAQKMGGSVLESPFETPTIGRMALLKDNCGAQFYVYTPNDWSRTQSAMGRTDGTICWNDLMVSDPSKATAFYSEIVGWNFEKSKQVPGSAYFEIKCHGEYLGGIGQTEAGSTYPSSTWMPYFMVSNLGSATEKAQKLGAKILKPAVTMKGIGSFTTIADPTGCAACLFQSASQG